MNFILSHWLSLIWLAVGKTLAVLVLTVISNLQYFQKRKLYIREAIKPEQSKREWLGLLLVPTDALVLTILIYFDWIRFASESLLAQITTIAIMILWVDLWMYVTHRLMHNSKFFWKSHRHHHLSKVSQPVTAISFSFVEKFFFYSVGWIGGITVISWFFPVSFDGIIIYFSSYFFLSAASHGNIEYFKDHFEVLQSPAIHGLHHLRPGVNFGFWTTLYDRIFGTYVSPNSAREFRN
jgi:sterol desaturase/sphingolipid hydroxylase (fatty acid hydroxylase superfamily)